MVVEVVSSLDTYIYAMISLIVWNFYWTRKMKGKVFGDPKDKTTAGLLVEYEELEQRVRTLEQETEIEDGTESDK